MTDDGRLLTAILLLPTDDGKLLTAIFWRWSSPLNPLTPAHFTGFPQERHIISREYERLRNLYNTNQTMIDPNRFLILRMWHVAPDTRRPCEHPYFSNIRIKIFTKNLNIQHDWVTRLRFVRTCTAIIFPKRVRNEILNKKEKRIVCEFAAGPDQMV